jgi:hypothetical protein
MTSSASPKWSFDHERIVNDLGGALARDVDGLSRGLRTGAVNKLPGYVPAGLASGGTYAVVGLGMSLVYHVTGIVNFAQGDFVMVGGLTYAVSVQNGTRSAPAAVVALAAAGACGALIHLAVVARSALGKASGAHFWARPQS